MSTPDRREMPDRSDKTLSIRRQRALTEVAHSCDYRPEKPANDTDLNLMRHLDELFNARPFLGSRRMTEMLRAQGETINRKRFQQLMRKMEIAAPGANPNTNKPALGHKTFLYFLRNLKIEQPNRVWAADITYLPIARRFLYLVAIIDWVSSADLARHISNTKSKSFCLAALEDVLARFGKPKIFNTKQSSRFTSAVFAGAPTVAGIKISVDGRGRSMDNVFIERLQRSLKYEDIYLKNYADGRDAKIGIFSWMEFNNSRRLHQALSYRTPVSVWLERTATAKDVDMTNNAAALTTCRQQQQKTKPLAA